MNVTALLTNTCNLRCTYCFEGACGVGSMNEETALRVCDFAFTPNEKRNGISFFGGEPLIKRDLIEKMVARCAELGDFSYNMTTNGILLDESFVEFARKNKIRIAFSHDGLAHDICRVFPDGSGSFDVLREKLSMVNSLPNSVIMLTTVPETVHMLSESVEWLYENGTKRVLVSTDGRPDRWDDDSFAVLSEQLEKCAADYEKRLLRGDRVRFPLFDVKISDRVRGENHCNNCHIGYKQPIIGTDGSLYPCIQFANRGEFKIGDIWNGFDEEKRRSLYVQSKQPVTTCIDCAIADRCRHSCPCANFEQTGSMTTVSPFTCASQRAVIELADRLAEHIYEKDPALFNSVYGGEREEYPVEV